MTTHNHSPIVTTIHALADEYGIERSEGDDASVTLYRDAEGWHASIGTTGDEDGWAPRDDAHAAELREALKNA